jgi:hypothetical protein
VVPVLLSVQIGGRYIGMETYGKPTRVSDAPLCRAAARPRVSTVRPTMELPVTAPAAVLLGGPLVGFLGGWLVAAKARGGIRETIQAEFKRQRSDHAHDIARDTAAAARAHASGVEEYVRPYLDDALKSARVITTACNAGSDVALEEFTRLDVCIDCLEQRPLTRTVGEACTELRVLAAQYRGAGRSLGRLNDQILGPDGPRAPAIERERVLVGERMADRAERTIAAADEVRAAVEQFHTGLARLQGI